MDAFGRTNKKIPEDDTHPRSTQTHTNKIAKHQELAICLHPDQKECREYGVCKHTGDVNAVGEGGVQHGGRSTIISMTVGTVVDGQE